MLSMNAGALKNDFFPVTETKSMKSVYLKLEPIEEVSLWIHSKDFKCMNT